MRSELRADVFGYAFQVVRKSRGRRLLPSPVVITLDTSCPLHRCAWGLRALARHIANGGLPIAANSRKETANG